MSDTSRFYVHLRHMIYLSKRYKTFAIFLIKIYHFFNNLFLSLSLLETSMFSCICLFLQLGHLVNFGSINFVEIWKRSMVMGGRTFLFFQPKCILNSCLNLNEPQPIYAYKRYAYKEECTCIPRKHKPFW